MINVKQTNKCWFIFGSSSEIVGNLCMELIRKNIENVRMTSDLLYFNMTSFRVLIGMGSVFAAYDNQLKGWKAVALVGCTESTTHAHRSC